MKILIYYQTDVSYDESNSRANEVISSLIECGHEIRYSTEGCYRNQLALLLKDIREYDFVLFVLSDSYSSPRSQYTRLHIWGPIFLTQYNLDIGILALLALRSASAVLSGGCVPKTLMYPKLRFDEAEDCEFRAVDSMWIVKAINAEGAKGVQLSDDFERRCNDLYRANKSITTKLARFYAWLHRTVERYKLAVHTRRVRSAVHNPSSHAAKQLSGCRGPNMTDWFYELSVFDPSWRDRETASRRVKRVSNWFRTLDQDTLFGNDKLESDVKWFAENYPEEALCLLNARGVPVLHDQFADKDARSLILHRARFRSYVVALSDISTPSLSSFDLQTCNLIEKHSLEPSTLKSLLLDHQAAQWHLTSRASSHIKQLLKRWPDEPPEIYDDQYAGEFIWGSPDDGERWRAARMRCREIWSKRGRSDIAS